MAWNRSSGETTEQKKARGLRLSVPLAAGAVALLILAAAGTWWAQNRSSTPAVRTTSAAKTSRKISKPTPAAKAQSPEEAVRNKMPKKMPKREHAARKQNVSVEMFAHLSGEDRKHAEAVQAGLDSDDLKATVAAAKQALASTNSEVRIHAVEALGWFGAEALPELTGCMADADAEVREMAENQWEQAVQQLDEPEDRFNLVAAAMGSLADEDQLRSLGGILGCAATEAIDGAEDEETTAARRVQVLQALTDIIEGGRPVNVAAAKEAYNDITGNEWISIDEAERYLADPDNYDPDDAGESPRE